MPTGDRLTIGQYVVRVDIAGVSGAAPSLSFEAVEAPGARQRAYAGPGDDIWGTGEPGAAADLASRLDAGSGGGPAST